MEPVARSKAYVPKTTSNIAKEYMRNCGDNSCLMVERYIKDGNADSDGVTVVNMNGDKSLAGTETTLDDGTYTDQVNGGTLTVSGGKITSGTAKGGKISVFYNSNLLPASPLTRPAVPSRPTPLR